MHAFFVIYYLFLLYFSLKALHSITRTLSSCLWYCKLLSLFHIVDALCLLHFKTSSFAVVKSRAEFKKKIMFSEFYHYLLVGYCFQYRRPPLCHRHSSSESQINDTDSSGNVVTPPASSLKVVESTTNSQTFEFHGEIFEVTSPKLPCDVKTCRFCFEVCPLFIPMLCSMWMARAYTS